MSAAAKTPTVPAKCTGRPKKASGLTASLRALEVGAYVEIPRSEESRPHKMAARLGIVVTLRRCGAISTTRVYRVR